MIKEEILGGVLYLNFLAFGVMLYLRLKNFNRNINKYKKPITSNRVSIEIMKIVLITLVALIISSVLCAFDGISNEKYLGIAFVIPAILGTILTVLYSIYFKRIAKRNNVQAFWRFNKDGHYIRESALLGFLNAVLIGQLIYTFVALISIIA